MNVLFVYKGPTNPIIDAQAFSISKKGINVIKFPLSITQPLCYFKEYIRLLLFIKKRKIDLIHAHYSYSGIISGLTFNNTVCSLMGSDVFNENWFISKITNLFYRYIWKITIVKSNAMQNIFPKSIVIPNGVNLETFKPLNKTDAIKKTTLNKNYKNIIFVVEKFHRNSKNFQLAKLVYSEHLDNFNTKLTLITNKTQQDLLYYYNAADVFLLTSVSEGSPNTIKEAMACNCPIVSTDIGDVKKVLGDTRGCYISSYDPEDVAKKLKKALVFGSRTKGRDQIENLGLDAEEIAEKIIKNYKTQKR